MIGQFNGTDMLNFTVGPVMSSEGVLEIGGVNTPYFRTPEFSDIMLENERLMVEFAKADSNARTVFITGSGTASMESVIANVLCEDDNILVVNGGGFGARFAELCDIYGYKHTDIILETGKTLTRDNLEQYESKGFTAFVVNIHETSTGVLYDLDMIGEFCRKNNMFLVVDAISSFLADPIDMQKNNVGVMITGSQKALACPPGVSIIVLAEDAIERIYSHRTKCMYLDLKNALKNGERGQTPFTPAVTTLLQINHRLKEIKANGGVEGETKRIAEVAEDFRKRIEKLPFAIASDRMSNAVTPLTPLTASAKTIFNILKDEYGIWICPNGGELADTLFRVGHIGAIRIEDNIKLVEALEDIKKRGII